MAAAAVGKGDRHEQGVVARNLALVEQVTRHLIAEPQLLGSLPDDFELVILPEDDPSLRLFNLELLDRVTHEGRPVVFVQVPAATAADAGRPRLYVPLGV